MSWTSPYTFVNGQVVTDSILNTYVSNNLTWLYDLVTNVDIATGVRVQRNDGAYEFELLRTSAPVGDFGIGISSADGSFDIDDLTLNQRRLTIFASGGLGFGPGASDPSNGNFWLTGTTIYFNSASLRAHRHPYANDRHIESGSVSLNAGASQSFTFAAAFAATPNAVTAMTNDTPCIITALSTTGITIKNASTGTQTCYWIAEGH